MASISLAFLVQFILIPLSDGTLSISSSTGDKSQGQSLLYRKSKHDHKYRSERSNASIAARKRLSHISDTSDTNPINAETGSYHESELVDYKWRGSRKKLLYNSFIVIWKNLMDRDSVSWDDQIEESIHREVTIL